MVRLIEHDETYIRVEADPGIERELFERFKFKAENFWFHPLYKQKIWNGDIHLFDIKDKTIYKGLKEDIINYCNKYGYPVEDKTRIPAGDFSITSASAFVSELGIPYEPRDYQLSSFVEAINKERLLIVSPTASGKSLICYFLMRYHKEKVLIIVPTITLVEQLYNDFKNYGFDVETNVKKISQNYSKELEGKSIVITTWQSIYRLGPKFFQNFETVILDEAHQAKAKSIITIMKKCSHVKYRYGLTGTLTKVALNNATLVGLFGPIYQVITTKELMENKTIAELTIHPIFLQYTDDDKKAFKATDRTYNDEIEFLINHEKRNALICKMAGTMHNQNVAILYSRVGKHGKKLYEKLKTDFPDKMVLFISGEVKAERREEIRKLCEENKNVIIVASFQSFATGTNIVNLQNAILVHSSKSRIRNLQSIGRILRKSLDNETCRLYDIVDNITGNNFSVRHFKERLKTYEAEQFTIKKFEVKL